MLQSNPFLIITCGLTASGKTDLAKKVIMDFGLVQDFDVNTTPLPYTHMLIDDYVESSREYNTHMDNLLKHHNLTEQSTDEQIKHFIKNPEVIGKTNEIYFGVRSSVIPSLPNSTIENDKYKSCDIPKGESYVCEDNNDCEKLDPSNADGLSICNKLFDCKLKELLKRKENIVLETVGKYIPTWLWENCFITDGAYDVYIAYSLVNIHTLNDRIPKRAIQQFQDYLNARRTNCPRIPSFGIPTDSNQPNRFMFDVYDFRKTLFELIRNCKTKCIQDIEKTKKSRKVENNIVTVVYDNNSSYRENLSNYKQIFNSRLSYTNISTTINNSMGIDFDLRKLLGIVDTMRTKKQPRKGGTRYRRRKHVRKTRRKYKRRLL